VRVRTLVALGLVVGLGVAGCASTTASTTASGSAAPTTPTPTTSTAQVVPTDYSDPAHWLAVPTSIDKPVDVFYLYPTSYTKANAAAPVVGPIDDPGMLAGAAVDLQRQASAFAPSANIFAPYYRQADTASRAAMPQAEQVQVVAGAPTVDGIAAFEYYLAHDNGGRPFILVSHSLGSNVMANLLEQYMPKHPDVYQRMVAAYVVGYSITPAYLAANPTLKFAEGPADTGVIVSWNTEATQVTGTNPVLLPGGIAINPITWTRDETPATAAQNLGSITLDPKTGLPVMGADGQPTKVMGLADARIDTAKGVIICDSVNPADYEFGMPAGVYHPFDYPFYYFDVRANAAERVAHFLAR
jgi:hypothetical protein